MNNLYQYILPVMWGKKEIAISRVVQLNASILDRIYIMFSCLNFLKVLIVIEKEPLSLLFQSK